jgi:hypothetical protein
MKIGINDDSKESASLVFECLVYDRLITPMLDAQMCPNFLRSYLLSTNCTYSDLEKTLRVGVKDLDRAQIATNLHRNLTFMAQKKNYRPAIDKLTPHTAFVPVVEPNDVPQLFASHRFIVISTEYTNVQSFKEWLKTPGLSSVDRYTVLLQILIALQVMSLAKLRHNDLHVQNILVRLEPQVLTYIIEGIDHPITFRTAYIALVFDFDRATCEPLGVNKLMSQKYQAFEDKRDLVCFYKNIMYSIDKGAIPSDVLHDLNLVFKTRQFTDLEIQWWSKGQHGHDIEPSILEGIERMRQLLEKNLEPPAKPFGPGANVYYATSKMFLPNGLLNRSSPDRLMLNKCAEDLRRCKESEHQIRTSPPHKKRRQDLGLREDVRRGTSRGTSMRVSEARTQDVQQTPTPRPRAVRMNDGDEAVEPKTPPKTPTPRPRAVRMDDGGEAVEPKTPRRVASMRASEAVTQDAQNITPARRTGTMKLISPRYAGPPPRLMSPLGRLRGIGFDSLTLPK